MGMLNTKVAPNKWIMEGFRAPKLQEQSSLPQFISEIGL